MEACIDDGLMDVAILPSDMDLLAGVRGLFNSDNGDGTREGVFVRARVSELEIETPEPMHLNLDGEPLKDKRFKLKVLPKALGLVVGNECPMLGASEG